MHEIYRFSETVTILLTHIKCPLPFTAVKIANFKMLSTGLKHSLTCIKLIV